MTATEKRAEEMMRNLCGLPGAADVKRRVDREVARELMLKSPLMAAGYMYDVKCRDVGAGICDVWMEARR